MSTDNEKIVENESITENELEVTSEVVSENETKTVPELIPSMDEFKDDLEKSFKKIKEGDILKGTVIGISDTEVIIDLRYYAEGIIKLEELSNDPRFSIKEDITIGEEISATVLSTDDGHGNILLSRKRADDILAWEHLQEDKDSKKIHTIKISQSVKGGAITYLYGIRAFIPASQISIAYIDDLETVVGKEIDTIIITVSAEDNKLVLSGKEVEQERAEKDRNSKINKLQKGFVTKGIVDKIVPYGAFVNLDNGLSGLLHISQISFKRLKSPNEVLKEGEEINVKIIDIKDGKISLNMKDVADNAVVEDTTDIPSSYSSGGEVTTGLADLLKNIKL
ncbi:MAG: S1 RNA-binding domain-containing protein [Clostridiales bacterium]|nr:S1 RNA-binding domain-containing protein [Clostridiales bacterium]